MQEKQSLVERLEEDLLASRTAAEEQADGSGGGAGGRGKLSGLMGDGGGDGEEEGTSSMVRVVCAQRDRWVEVVGIQRRD